MGVAEFIRGCNFSLEVVGSFGVVVGGCEFFVLLFILYVVLGKLVFFIGFSFL